MPIYSEYDMLEIYYFTYLMFYYVYILKFGYTSIIYCEPSVLAMFYSGWSMFRLWISFDFGFVCFWIKKDKVKYAGMVNPIMMRKIQKNLFCSHISPSLSGLHAEQF